MTKHRMGIKGYSITLQYSQIKVCEVLEPTIELMVEMKLMDNISVSSDDGLPTVCGGNEDGRRVVNYPCIKYNSTSGNWTTIGSPTYAG